MEIITIGFTVVSAILRLTFLLLGIAAFWKYLRTK